MKSFGIIILSAFVLTSCDQEMNKEKCNLKPIELRQIIKDKETVKSASFGYFVFAASGSYSETEELTVKVCGKVDGSYRFLEFDINDIRIKIDNSVKTPYLKLNVNNDLKNKYASTILDYHNWEIRSVTIVCSDEMLPERLLPIDITKN